MSKLSNDELSLILNWVHDKNDRKSVSLVCKQWLRVEGETRLSIRVIDPDLLQSFLPRFPNLISFESFRHITNAHVELIAKTCPKLEFLNLTLKHSRDEGNNEGFEESSEFDDVGVIALASACYRLSKVFLRRRQWVGNAGVVNLAKCARNLTTLDLGRCVLVSDQSLEAIGELSSIRILNLEACSLITDRGLACLATGCSARTLKKLVLAECDRVTDLGVSLLQSMCCLEELNLAECGPKITDNGGLAIASILGLKRLNFSWLINLSDITLVAIAENCQDLVAFDLTGCEMITGAGIRSFAYHACLESIILASCQNICRDDVDTMLKCKSLRYIVLDKGLRMWIPLRMQESMSRFCQLNWR